MRDREVERKLRAVGCVELPRRGGGSNRKWHDLAAAAWTVVPDWVGGDLEPGTVWAAIRQLGLDREACGRA